MSFIPTRINLVDLKVNNADHTSSLSFGTNILVGIHVSGKKSQGFGHLNSDNSVHLHPNSEILDGDTLDSVSIKNKK